jgi:tetratricopeptide (TPR) repeat protein
MTAASAPRPEEVPDPAPEAAGWALLEGLRRRLDDQATLGRKTAAQVSQLAESIAALVAQQRRRSQWLNVNSFAAYLIFTILCGAGSYLLYRSRASELIAARDRAVSDRDAAVRRADEATGRGLAREAAAARAWEVYELLQAGRRGDAIGKLEALRDQPLSRTERTVLAARVHDTQVMEIDAALKAAVASIKAGRPAEVVKPLEAALAGEPAGARAAAIHYYLGVGYAKTELDKSATHFQAAIAGDVDQDDARFQLASVLDRSGAYAQARAEYDRFATAHPQSPLAVFAMRRSATLARLPPGVPPGAAARPGPGALAPGSPQPAALAPPRLAPLTGAAPAAPRAAGVGGAPTRPSPARVTSPPVPRAPLRAAPSPAKAVVPPAPPAGAAAAPAGEPAPPPAGSPATPPPGEPAPTPPPVVDP